MDKGSEAWGLGLKGCLLGVQLQALGIWAGASNSEFRVGVKGLRAQRSGKHTNGNHNEVYQPSTRLPKKPKIGHTRIIGQGLETNIREMV